MAYAVDNLEIMDRVPNLLNRTMAHENGRCNLKLINIRTRAPFLCKWLKVASDI